MQVHTAYGPGEIIERDVVRGRTQLKVAGRGFEVWVNETDVRVAASPYPADETYTENINTDNSTTLPYDPEPQYPAHMFSGESTIQPGEHEIDIDERTSPADSLTFDDRSEPSGPGPSPDLFAKSASPISAIPAILRSAPGGVGGAAGGGLALEHLIEEGGELLDDAQELQNKSRGPISKGIDESPLGMILGSADVNLGPKYATWLLDAAAEDHFNDPVQRFRDDPIREIHRQGHLLSAELDPEIEQYGHLVEADRDLREAAWADVRNKAKRLRRDGHIEVHDITPERIYATVKGDNGTYDVMVKKGGEFGGFGRGQTVTDYSCSCQWGRWAFRRQYKFVGRMCSHALAAYHEMQSRYLKDNPEHFQRRQKVAGAITEFEDWAAEVGAGLDVDSVTDFIELHPGLSDDDIADLYDLVTDEPQRAEQRDYTDPLDGWQDEALYSGPSRVTPELELPADDDDYSGFTDVTSDDRETTGPEQIVHFSHLRQAAPGDRRRDNVDGLAEMMGVEIPATGGPAQSYLNQMNSIVPGAGDIERGSPADPTGGLLTAPYQGDSGAAQGTDSPGGGAGASGTPAAPTGGSPSGGGDSGSGSGWTPNTNTDPIEAGEYTVQAGDTLSSIAERAGIDDYMSIADANDNITDPDMIYAGDTINIPGATDTAGGADATDVGTPHAGTGADPGPAPGVDATGPDASMPTVGGDVPGMGVDAGADAIDNTPMEVTGGRFLYANPEDFEEDDPTAADLSVDPAEPGVAGNAALPSEAVEPVTESATPSSNDLMTDPAEPGVAGNYDNTSGGAGFDPSMLMDVVGPIAQGVSTFAAPIAQGIGSGIGNALSSGLSGIFSHVRTADLLEHLRDLSAEPQEEHFGNMAERNNEIAEVVTELRERGLDADQIVACADAPHKSFAGSGPNHKHHWDTSGRYVEKHERPRHIDVTDGDDDITRADKPQQKASGVRRAGRPVPQVTPQRAANRSSYRPPEDFGFDGAPPRMGSATDDNSDIVRAFHAALGANGGGALSGDSGNYDDNAIAARAASMLRTAGRTYTLAEQRALENESHPLGARNMPTEDDLAGTHYVS